MARRCQRSGPQPSRGKVITNKKYNRKHRHVVLAWGTRTNDAQKYPESLCKDLVKAIKHQKAVGVPGSWADRRRPGGKDRGGEHRQQRERDPPGARRGGGARHTQRRHRHRTRRHQWEALGLGQGSNRRGPMRVSATKKMGVYVKVPTSESFPRTEQKPIRVRLGDIDTGDRERHNYRPRLAAIHCGQERGKRLESSSAANRVTACCDLIRDHRGLGEGDHGKRRESRVHVRFLRRGHLRGTWWRRQSTCR